MCRIRISDWSFYVLALGLFIFFKLFQMSAKLNCIMLVDNDEPTNFLHKMVVESSGFTGNIEVAQGAEVALEYLNDSTDNEQMMPDLIFLDINMPAMNGWEFLEEFGKTVPNKEKPVVIVMLSTSLNPDDKERALGIDAVSGFKSKPLTPDDIQDIIKTHFPENEISA